VSAEFRTNRQQVIQNRSRLLRRGFMTTEVVVAASLLITITSVVVPLAMQSKQLWQDSGRYRLALGELSNQLERLTGLEEADRETALAGLSVSPEVSRRLPNAELRGKTIEDRDGKRIVLQIDWDRPGPAEPLTLTAWTGPPGASVTDKLDEERVDFGTRDEEEGP